MTIRFHFKKGKQVAEFDVTFENMTGQQIVDTCSEVIVEWEQKGWKFLQMEVSG